MLPCTCILYGCCSFSPYLLTHRGAAAAATALQACNKCVCVHTRFTVFAIQKTNYKMCVIGSSLKYWQAIYGIDLKTYSIDLHLGARVSFEFRWKTTTELTNRCAASINTPVSKHTSTKSTTNPSIGKFDFGVNLLSQMCGGVAAVCCSRRFWKLIINEENLWFEWRDRLRCVCMR